MTHLSPTHSASATTGTNDSCTQTHTYTHTHTHTHTCLCMSPFTKVCTHQFQDCFTKVVRVEHKRACLCAVSLASTAESSASPLPPLCTTDTYKQGDVITYLPTLPSPKVEIFPQGTTLVAEITPILTILHWLQKLSLLTSMYLVAEIPPALFWFPSQASVSQYGCRQSDLRSNTGKCAST